MDKYIRTKVTRHMNDEYELFTHVYTSKCVVTFVPVTLLQANITVTRHVNDLIKIEWGTNKRWPILSPNP